MLKSIYLQQFIALLNALMIGFIIERISGSLRYGGISSIIACIIILFLFSKRFRKNLKFSFDKEITATLLTILLAVAFLIECILAAWLILS
ncbi:hypothetical protein K9N50_10225 [bacterium]|nr:hypothetical protein [bacterium]